jgi:hypothetical protein
MVLEYVHVYEEQFMANFANGVVHVYEGNRAGDRKSRTCARVRTCE